MPLQATDAAGVASYLPVPGAAPGEGAQFEGRVIAAPLNATLPVLHW